MTKEIAVIGIDCYFPGASDPSQYWRMLLEGQVHDFTLRDGNTPDKEHVRCKSGEATLDHADQFNPEYFGISPSEAALMDPQQRLVLMSAWRAIEDAGHSPKRMSASKTGVYIGLMSSEWTAWHICHPEMVSTLSGSGSGFCMVANRVSYCLNLTGPSIAIDTACSSSLTALHYAYRDLQTGECDYALVGGVNLLLGDGLGAFYNVAGLSSAKGMCRPFSNEADGISRSEGVGVVFLRRLDDAIAEGDPIYCNVLATAINHNGRANGITAPSRWAQVSVMKDAYKMAGVTPDDISFLEAHGTGTKLGDRIEINALTDIHNKDTRSSPLPISSIKGNFGHAEGAAGIAGFIKAVLTVAHRSLPGAPWVDDGVAPLGGEKSFLEIPRYPKRFSDNKIIGSISSFGLGGSNAHVVVSSHDHHQIKQNPLNLLTEIYVISAPTEHGLRESMANKARTLSHSSYRASALGRTSQSIDSGWPYRCAVLAKTNKELSEKLLRKANDHTPLGGNKVQKSNIAFMMPGQGDEYENMAIYLCDEWKVFADHYFHASGALDSAGQDLNQEDPDSTWSVQSSLFRFEYAFGASLMDIGIVPGVFFGHSLGEIVAATLAGVIDLDYAASIVVQRTIAMDHAPIDGAMLAVRASYDAIRPYIEDIQGFSVAAFNSPSQIVLSGDNSAISDIESRLKVAGFRTMPLRTRRAFHSQHMAEAASNLYANLTKMPQSDKTELLDSSQILLSTVTGKMVNGNLSASHWAEQLTKPVLFSDIATLALDMSITHFIEIGPRSTLSKFIKNTAPAVTVIDFATGGTVNGDSLREGIARLYEMGVNPDWEILARGRHTTRVHGIRSDFYPLAQYPLRRSLPYVEIIKGHLDDEISDTAIGSTKTQNELSDKVSIHIGETKDHLTDDLSLSQPGGSNTFEVLVRCLRLSSAISPDRIQRDTNISEELGLDSVGLVHLRELLIGQIPELSDITFTDLLPYLTTAGELADYLDRLLFAVERMSTLERSI